MIKSIVNIVKDVGTNLKKIQMDNRKGVWVGTQFKAEADKIAHHQIKSALNKLPLKIPIISEEDVHTHKEVRPSLYWLIDPIDGTASFANGYSGFVTQIALIKENKPVMGAIFAPLLSKLYTAEIGKGSYLNGEKLSLANQTTFNSLIDNYPEPRGIAKKIYNDFQLTKYIECGSISLKICKIADKTADLFIKDVVVRDWDIAPAQLILEEAGGYITDLYGRKFKYSGSYEQIGVIAASSHSVSNEIINWYEHNRERDE